MFVFQVRYHEFGINISYYNLSNLVTLINNLVTLNNYFLIIIFSSIRLIHLMLVGFQSMML